MDIIFKHSVTHEVLGKIDNATPMHMIYAKNDRLDIDCETFVVDKINHVLEKYPLSGGVTQGDITIMCLKVSGSW